MNKREKRNDKYVNKHMKTGRHFKIGVGLVILILLWFVVCETEIFNAYVLPPPQKVLKTLWKMFLNGELFRDIRISLQRVLQGFFIAFVLAFVLGTVSSLLPGVREYYEWLIQFLRNVPPLSMIPLLILWCGIGETTKIVIIILASFFPMYLNIVKGFLSCDEKLIEVAVSFDYSRLKCFQKVILPHAIPDILVGMRTGLGYSWRAIIGAEMVAASSGIGHLILFAQQMSRTDKVIAGILIIGVVGYVTDKIFALAIRKLLRGAGENGWN